MLKYRAVLTAGVFVCIVLLSPLPSHASPARWTDSSGPAAVRLPERWWSSLLNGGRPAPQERSHAPKAGCAIDPNGLLGTVVCIVDPGLTGSTTPTSTAPSGSK